MKEVDMPRAFIRTFLIFLIMGLSTPLSAQEDDFDLGDFLCPETERDLDAGDEFTLNEDLSLVMMAAFIHINRSNAGEEVDADDGCVLATVELEGDELVIFKFLDISGEFASRYQFVLMSEAESDTMIALNTFSDLDAVAHELELIPPEARLYHLDKFAPDYIATHALFVGEPSVNSLINSVMKILYDESTPMITVDLSGEEAAIIIREDLMEEESE